MKLIPISYTAPVVVDNSVSMRSLFQGAHGILKEQDGGLTHQFIAGVLRAGSNSLGSVAVSDLWRKSGLQWETFMPADKVQQFLEAKVS